MNLIKTINKLFHNVSNHNKLKLIVLQITRLQFTDYQFNLDVLISRHK